MSCLTDGNQQFSTDFFGLHMMLESTTEGKPVQKGQWYKTTVYIPSSTNDLFSGRI